MCTGFDIGLFSKYFQLIRQHLYRKIKVEIRASTPPTCDWMAQEMYVNHLLIGSHHHD